MSEVKIELVRGILVNDTLLFSADTDDEWEQLKRVVGDGNAD